MKIASIIVSALLTMCMPLCAQNQIDTAEVISVGGIHQYITIKGKDRSLPLLLFLHGGPGGSVLNYADKFTHRLQHHFVVIQWDQRQTGETLALNASPVALSLDVFQRDTHEMIRAMLTKFGREKLYLVAHSWGTALGFHVAKNYPSLLYAYLPIGSMVDQVESERIALGVMKERASTARDLEAIAELDKVRIPFENAEQLYYHRKWLLRQSKSRKNLSRTFVEEWAQTWLHVFNEASRENLLKTAPAIGCPVYFFAGKKDYQTNSELAEKYFVHLSAPKKGFFWFEHSGHFIPSSEPDRLQAIIIDTILPATYILRESSGAVTHH